MSKFKKKKGGELPAISTASLPDIVFMLLFFFMVATVMRDNSTMVENTLPAADQIEKLKKDRTMFIYAGKPSAQYSNLGTEGRIQINDSFVSLDAIQPAVFEYIASLPEELKDRIVIALKVDEKTNAGIISDIKQELREANALKIMYITGKKSEE
ncbi:biopolymer transporter ExbD [uncultured Winogradskyella sp.]|jgi:biopolymer transport protein ExbD|uniref:ExbD/TolR family protein n=1 Tax=Winogradskyella sp. TaxID=1883156 RepID=UPI00231B4139|nr:biopolymer transporter ExbD [uncultured Winogradskyella sp.]MDA8768674.1 biopolymer transporter ExbD [Winogradskyella sp.]MDC3260321.1 biopolymer transporter ExbD [Winogradskyella sp.]MDG1661199.1 biopolymer transporter ExbD [Winogradskyella sp.]